MSPYGISILAISLLAGAPSAAGPMYTDADPAVLKARSSVFQRAGASGVELYQPQQAVPGGRKRPLPLAPTDRRTVSATALATAQAYSDGESGIGLAVWQGGALQYEHYAKGFGPADRTESFSMNKSVTALMVGAAIADGLIGSVDDPVGRYLQEWRSDPRGAITLRQLLSMSSGLKIVSAGAGDTLALELMVSDHIEDAALRFPLQSTPGSIFKYNNANFQLAGAVVRRVLARRGGETYAHYLSERLWKPLGQTDAHLWAESPNGAPRFYAGMQATLHDWVRLGLLIMDKGRVGDRQILPAAWIDQMTTPSADNPKYGLGVWLGGPYAPERFYAPEYPVGVRQSAPYLAPDVIFFDGSGGQRVYIVPSRRLVIVRTGEPRGDWDDAVLVNTIIGGLKVSAH